MRAAVGAPGATGGTGATGATGPVITSAIALVAFTLAGAAWAIPSSPADLFGSASLLRVPVYLVGATQWRIVAFLTTAAGTGAKFRGMYATTANGALTTMGNGGDTAADTTSSIAGAWTALPAGAQADCFVTVQGRAGDGLTAGVIQYLGIEFR